MKTLTIATTLLASVLSFSSNAALEEFFYCKTEEGDTLRVEMDGDYYVYSYYLREHDYQMIGISKNMAFSDGTTEDTTMTFGVGDPEQEHLLNLHMDWNDVYTKASFEWWADNHQVANTSCQLEGVITSLKGPSNRGL